MVLSGKDVSPMPMRPTALTSKTWWVMATRRVYPAGPRQSPPLKGGRRSYSGRYQQRIRCMVLSKYPRSPFLPVLTTVALTAAATIDKGSSTPTYTYTKSYTNSTYSKARTIPSGRSVSTDDNKAPFRFRSATATVPQGLYLPSVFPRSLGRSLLWSDGMP